MEDAVTATFVSWRRRADRIGDEDRPGVAGGGDQNNRHRHRNVVFLILGGASSAGVMSQPDHAGRTPHAEPGVAGWSVVETGRAASFCMPTRSGADRTTAASRWSAVRRVSGGIRTSGTGKLEQDAFAGFLQQSQQKSTARKCVNDADAGFWLRRRHQPGA